MEGILSAKSSSKRIYTPKRNKGGGKSFSRDIVAAILPVEASCRRQLVDIEREELRATDPDEEELRAGLASLQQQEKGRTEELLASAIQSIMELRKTLAEIAVEDQHDVARLRKQTSQLTNDKIRLQQHVVALASKVECVQLDVCSKASGI